MMQAQKGAKQATPMAVFAGPQFLQSEQQTELSNKPDRLCKIYA